MTGVSHSTHAGDETAQSRHFVAPGFIRPLRIARRIWLSAGCLTYSPWSIGQRRGNCINTADEGLL
jgi:hypothetical protein